MIQLRDDGTLDTVFFCTDCKAEMRYTWEPMEDVSAYLRKGGAVETDTYEGFVAWAIEDAQERHECASPEGAE